MQPGILALSMERAGKMIALYWGRAMVGRIASAYTLRIARRGYVFAGCAIGAASLALVSSFTTGTVAAYTLIAVGLCNSIMIPTIFKLATEQLGDARPNGAGLLCMAILGGAIMPLVMGAVADRTSLTASPIVPAICYLGILLYGILAARGLGLDKTTARAR